MVFSDIIITFAEVKQNVMAMELTQIARNITALVLLVASFALLSCSDDDEGTSGQQEMESTIVAFYPPEGLGDMTFVDGVYRGVESAVNEHGLLLYFYVPDDLETGCEQLRQIICNRNFPTKMLILVLGAQYEEVVRECSDSIAANENLDVALIETRSIIPNVSTVYISLYGALYEASHLVATMDDVQRTAIVNALPGLAATTDAVEGFLDGPMEEDDVETLYLSDSFDGFNMADSLYRLSYELDTKYDLVVPLCGGSMLGLLRYNREFPTTSFYTIGMDADMSIYSSRVPFSCVKRGGDVAKRCIEQWLYGELPQYQFFGLENGYTEIEIADGTRTDWQQLISEIEDEAIRKEKEYEARQQQ